MLGFRCQLGMGEKAERVEAVVERHDHDAAGGEARPVVARLRTRADGEAAAVNPDHDREPFGTLRFGLRPDVEGEAVLGEAACGEVDVVEDDALQ